MNHFDDRVAGPVRLLMLLGNDYKQGNRDALVVAEEEIAVA